MYEQRATKPLKMLEEWCPTRLLLAPMLFYIYLYDIPPTKAAKYAYADDIVIRSSSKKWEVVESNLNQDVATLATYLNNWRLVSAKLNLSYPLST